MALSDAAFAAAALSAAALSAAFLARRGTSSKASSAFTSSKLILFPAPCTAPNPQGKRHADKRRSHAPAKGTRRRTRAPPHCKRELALHRAPARSRRPWDRATRPPSPATASTELRTFEAERCERRVLLERGRQSSRAVVADVIVCGVHSTQPTRQASHQQEEEPRARQGDPTPHARAAQLQARARSASCARAQPPAVIPCHTPPLPIHC